MSNRKKRRRNAKNKQYSPSIPKRNLNTEIQKTAKVIESKPQDKVAIESKANGGIIQQEEGNRVFVETINAYGGFFKELHSFQLGLEKEFHNKFTARITIFIALFGALFYLVNSEFAFANTHSQVNISIIILLSTTIIFLTFGAIFLFMTVAFHHTASPPIADNIAHYIKNSEEHFRYKCNGDENEVIKSLKENVEYYINGSYVGCATESLETNKKRGDYLRTANCCTLLAFLFIVTSAVWMFYIKFLPFF